MNHQNYKSKMPNGWFLKTEFIIFDEKSKNYEEAKEDFIQPGELEKLHYRILQYFKDFGELPTVGDILDDELDLCTIHEKTISLDTKTIILSIK